MAESPVENFRGRRSNLGRTAVDRGFTLLQMLSFAAIVGIALSLLLPALMRWLGFNL
jgi:type II secretory pathway pseudopilin PulG